MLWHTVRRLSDNRRINNVSFSVTMALALATVPFNGIFHLLAVGVLVKKQGNALVFMGLYPLIRGIESWLQPLQHVVGDWVLTQSLFQPVFNQVINWPVINFLNWNNTVFMGAYMVFFLLAYPLNHMMKIVLTAGHERLMDHSLVKRVYRIPS